MYGPRCSRTDTEGCLCTAILFASFLTMTTVTDIIRDDCFRDQRWKVMNLAHIHAHTDTDTDTVTHTP